MTDTAPSTRAWWNLKEAAAHMGVHKNTLRKLALKSLKKYARTRQGLPAVRFHTHGHFRFPIDAFKAWVEHPTE